MTRVLIIEDEPDIAELIAYNLRREGFQPTVASNGREGFDEVLRIKPHLIVLDLMIPMIRGDELCRILKSRPDTRWIPILMVTAKGEESDRIRGFEVGADDYLVKPFSPRELTLRVRAILNRSGVSTEKTQVFEEGKIWLDPTAHEVKIAGVPAQLTAREFKLLEFFLKNTGRVLPRELLLDQVWGYAVAITPRAVDTHVKRLREKLGVAEEQLETIRGVGYRLNRFLPLQSA